MDLTRNRFLDRFTRFQKAGQCRIAPRRPALAATEQGAAVMLSDHDHHRVDTREMLGAATRALARPAGAERRGHGAAIGAELVARMPVDQAARCGIGRRLARLQRGQRMDHRRGTHRRRLGGARAGKIGGKVRPSALVESEQDQHRVVGRIGQRGPAEPTIIADLGMQSVELEQPRAPVAHRRSQRLAVLAQMIGTVECAAGEAGGDHIGRAHCARVIRAASANRAGTTSPRNPQRSPGK